MLSPHSFLMDCLRCGARREQIKGTFNTEGIEGGGVPREVEVGGAGCY